MQISDVIVGGQVRRKQAHLDFTVILVIAAVNFGDELVVGHCFLFCDADTRPVDSELIAGI